MDFGLMLDLFWSFFKIGLFAVGGGPATLPFLMELAETKPWYTIAELTDMIAISESTPGPLGLNMATYAGFTTLGTFGGFVSTMGLVLPSIIIITIIAKFMANFSKNRLVQAGFRGIRPAVTALIACAVLNLVRVSLFAEANGQLVPVYGSIAVAAAAFLLMQNQKMKKLHPALWFVLGAAAGVIFRL